ncbi:hypothetical protein ANN_16267 [Periplaneta americana]|uniref:Uncharacterized protein n=1 Tax=Periplaneta americana TaxID=6978 RepID=A0ABQ8SIH0_PERAM|nr:hypothetical protein ANN_16267 [Periplaneta americana]
MTKFTRNLENNFYIHSQSLSPYEKTVIKNTMKLARSVTFMYFGSLCTTTTIMVLTPPILALTTNSTKLMIWKVWYPVDASQYPYNIFIYIHQILGTVSEGCFVIGSVNAFYFAIIICMASQYKLLCVSLRNAKKFANVNDSSTVLDFPRDTKDRKMGEYVKRCVKYHQRLLQ